MTALNPDAFGETVMSDCWCCGRDTADDALVRLSSHPEVGVCVNCALFLARRARDIQATVLRKQLRGTAESIRRQVMARNLHNQPVIGRVLRWINQHSPW